MKLARPAHQAPTPIDRIDDLIGRHARPGVSSPVPRQDLVLEDHDLWDVPMVYDTMLCLVTRGTKRVDIAGEARQVGRAEMLVSLLEMPVTGQFSSPYRSVSMLVDPEAVAAIAPQVHRRAAGGAPGFTSAAADEPLVDAMARWVGLLDEPEAIAVLGPRYEEEVLYRALTGPLGGVLLQAGRAGALTQIRSAVRHLLDHVDEDVTPEELAQIAAMSPSSFNRRFRALTGMSPKQYHKHVRLDRARHLLARGRHSASGAAAAVGYVSASHFSRDYLHRFGRTPAAHARELTAR